MNDLRDDEIALENQSLLWGRARYMRNLERAEPGSLGPEREIIHAALEGLTAAINAWLTKCKSGEAVKAPAGWRIIATLGAKSAAIITMRTLLWRLRHSSQVPFTSIACFVGATVVASIDYKEIVKKLPWLERKMKQMLRRNKPDYRLSVIRRTGARHEADLEMVNTTTAEQARIGGTLIKMALEVTSIAQLVLQNEGKHKRYVVRRADAYLEYVRGEEMRRSLLSPMSQPMVVPPIPYNTRGAGGYLTEPLQAPLVKRHGSAEIPEKMLSAINALQNTKWQVNEAVLSVTRRCVDEGAAIFDFERMEQIDRRKPPEKVIPPEEWNSPFGKAYRNCLFEWHTCRNQAITREVCLRTVVETAARFTPYDEFYYVHQVDTRGRAYPVATCFHPQAEDLSRGLLRFAEGVPLGKRGYFWLLVHAASMHEGGDLKLDKHGFATRAAWAREHLEEIKVVGRDPMGEGWDMWKAAANPWQFLAAAEELSRAGANCSTFLTHLPVSMDGTCNGLQHFAAMMLDWDAARNVGMTISEKPADVYSLIAKRINEDLLREDSELARKWAGKVTRKLIKQNVMTTPYGVTPFGRKNQIMDAFCTVEVDDRKDIQDATFLASKVEAAIRSLVSAAPKAMQFLKDCCAIVTAAGKVPAWRTPTGFRVVQDIPKTRVYQSQVCGYWLSFIEDIPGTVNPRASSHAIAPNFVHSLDAAHMMGTVNALVKEGFKSFAMIHDSYGIHAPYVDRMNEILRAQFALIYQENQLEKFRNEMQKLVPEVELPPVPPMGDYDILEVLSAAYFFC